MPGTDLTLATAIAAGLISFLSPCVLPLVPAYLGQLTAVAVASNARGVPPSRWVAFRHALAFVFGFGAIFTTLGVTATFAGGFLFDYLDVLRQVGGIALIVMGLSLAGVLRIPFLERTWRPLDPAAARSLASVTGSVALAAPTSRGEAALGPPVGWADRLGARVVSSRGGWLTSLGMGAIFAVGWTPCIGIILGGILMMSATAQAQGGILLAGYSLGLGLPFLILGALYDRAPGLLRPLLRRGALVAAIGGWLVVAIGVAMLFDLLELLPRYFDFQGV